MNISYINIDNKHTYEYIVYTQICIYMSTCAPASITTSAPASDCSSFWSSSKRKRRILVWDEAAARVGTDLSVSLLQSYPRRTAFSPLSGERGADATPAPCEPECV